MRLLGHKVVVTSSGAAAGGPEPDRRRRPARTPSATAERGRAARAVGFARRRRDDAARRLAPRGLRADLFDGLDVPWLEPVTVADLSERSAVPMNADDLAYTERGRDAELDTTNFTRRRPVASRADLLAGVLTLRTLVRQQVADEALMSLSSATAASPTRRPARPGRGRGSSPTSSAEVTVEPRTRSRCPARAASSAPTSSTASTSRSRCASPRRPTASSSSRSPTSRSSSAPGTRFRVLPDRDANRARHPPGALASPTVDGDPSAAPRRCRSGPPRSAA